MITATLVAIAFVLGWFLSRKTLWPEPHTHWHVEATDEAISRHVTKITNRWEHLYGYDIRTIKPGYYQRGNEIARLSRRLGKARQNARDLRAINADLRRQLESARKVDAVGQR